MSRLELCDSFESHFITPKTFENYFSKSVKNKCFKINLKINKIDNK
jgi:hypothetical protein